MSLLPFFSTVFLIVNPALYWLFKRFDLNIKKLDFWIMLTTGTAWVISVAFFFLTPEQHLNPIWDAGETLLPSLAFSLDSISSSYFLAVTSLVFFGILVEEFSPQTSVWITTMGGVCVIGTVVDSAYTFALIWTVIESLSLFRYLKNQGEIERNQGYILVILIRLAAPLLVIFVSVINSTIGIAPFLTEIPSSAAPYLLAAGIIGFIGWALPTKGLKEDQPVFQPGRYASWIPAVLGLVLLSRTASIFSGNGSSQGLFITGAVLLFLISTASTLFSKPEQGWQIGILALLIGSVSFAAPKAVLAWGVIFLLPGIVLFRNFKSNKTATLALILGGIGILPLPFLPAWAGLTSFDGIPGVLYASLAGILLGKTLNLGIQTRQGKGDVTEPISPLVITGYSVVLVSQLVISFQSGLIGISLAFSGVPLSAWIALVFFIPATLFWSRIPELKIIGVQKFIVQMRKTFGFISVSFPRSINGAVYLVIRLFEGDGGLIWTLLFGFLIITLISLRGG